MIRLSDKTLKVLSSMINEETRYRSGPQLVDFFNALGFRDVYKWGGGFPSRSTYTEDRLTKINCREEIEKAIKTAFAPRNFDGDQAKYAECIERFNTELRFDGWEIFFDESLNEISFRRVKPPSQFAALKKQDSVEKETTDSFLKKQFAEINLDDIIAIPEVLCIVKQRLGELKKCMDSGASLSALFLIGSILEGTLLAVAMKHASKFAAAKSAIKDANGKVVQIPNWKLAALIDTAKELGFIKEDVHRFCHYVRDYRNYIHPYEQYSQRFAPDVNTVNIAFQVLKGAVAQIHEWKADARGTDPVGGVEMVE